MVVINRFNCIRQSARARTQRLFVEWQNVRLPTNWCQQIKNAVYLFANAICTIACNVWMPNALFAETPLNIVANWFFSVDKWPIYCACCGRPGKMLYGTFMPMHIRQMCVCDFWCVCGNGVVKIGYALGQEQRCTMPRNSRINVWQCGV